MLPVFGRGWLANPGCSCLARDDHGRTALHWAAASGLCETAEALVAAAEAERMAPATGDANGGGAAPAPAPILLQEIQVRLTGSMLTCALGCICALPASDIGT